MKKMKLSPLAAFAALSVLLFSCTAVIVEPEDCPATTSETAMMRIRISKGGNVKSSISPDENIVDNICVMAYSQEDGRLAQMQTGKSADEIEMELRSGMYNIYVTANMGTFDAPADEEDIQYASYAIESLSDLAGALPMCWKGKTEIKAGTNTTVYASLSRLVSKVGFNVEMGVLEGLKITSVRVRQGAGRLRPFMDGGSRILSADEAIDGDRASDEDIRILTEGGFIYFYVTENCQGELLPDNSDPWSKVPENIGEMSELCTYVEMEGEWEEGADYEGTVTYRFYLGEDASKSFDIRRNSMHNLTLYLEEESFDKISWKIDASGMESVDWDITSDMGDNFHEKDNFYVTENICIEFTLDAKAQKYWQKKNYSFALAGVDYEGNVIVRFQKPQNLGKGKFRAIGTCIAQGDFDVLMINTETGSIEYALDYGTVHTPVIIAGEDDLYADWIVEGFDCESSLKINGDACEICLYLTDRDGYNLNQGHYYGCDFSVCDWDLAILNSSYGHDLAYNATVEVLEGDSGSDGYAACYRLSLENDGTDATWNRQLTESIGSKSLQIRFTEQTSGASANQPLSLGTIPIEITFKPVPDNKREYMGTEFMYMVDNMSNIPIKIRGLKLNSMNREPHPSEMRTILCNEIPWHTCAMPLFISKMPYTVCSLESGASKSAIIDGKTCYAAAEGGIRQRDIPDQIAMFHTFELSYVHSNDTGMTEFIGNTDFYDTEAHLATYGQNGYHNCGIIIHAENGGRANIFDRNNGARVDFRQYGDIMEKDFIKRFHNTVEVYLSVNENNEITATASEEIDLDITVSGSMRGHIRCVSVQDPFNTLWGQYFTYTQNFSGSTSARIGKDPVAIDSGALAGAFAKMREQKYYSVQDAWKADEFRNPKTMAGTIREYLKPEYVYLTFDIISSDDTPVSVSFSGTIEYDYKTSSPISWPTGIGSYAQIVPSSYSGYDNGLSDDGCPPGSVFKAELLRFDPYISYGNSQELYCR